MVGLVLIDERAAAGQGEKNEKGIQPFAFGKLGVKSGKISYFLYVKQKVFQLVLRSDEKPFGIFRPAAIQFFKILFHAFILS